VLILFLCISLLPAAICAVASENTPAESLEKSEAYVEYALLKNRLTVSLPESAQKCSMVFGRVADWTSRDEEYDDCICFQENGRSFYVRVFELFALLSRLRRDIPPNMRWVPGF